MITNNLFSSIPIDDTGPKLRSFIICLTMFKCEEILICFKNTLNPVSIEMLIEYYPVSFRFRNEIYISSRDISSKSNSSDAKSKVRP